MTKHCVFDRTDVPPSYRDDFDEGFAFTRDWAKRVSDDEVADEAYMARERITSGELSESMFWRFHGVLAAIADATGACPICQRTNGPCDAAGKAA